MQMWHVLAEDFQTKLSEATTMISGEKQRSRDLLQEQDDHAAEKERELGVSIVELRAESFDMMAANWEGAVPLQKKTKW